MSEVIRRLPGLVSNARGAFSVSVVARDSGPAGWEGWLAFAPAWANGAADIITGIETRQRDRLSLERWASGLTGVYAEGALARAVDRHTETPAVELLEALQEIVDALDRRLPHIERTSEAAIAADARRLRAGAVKRIHALRETTAPRG